MRRCASRTARQRISWTDQRISERAALGVILSWLVFLGAARWRDGGSPPTAIYLAARPHLDPDTQRELALGSLAH